jgi:hypothetical protein
MRTSAVRSAAMALVVLTSASLAGCSSKGSNTTCSDYRAMSSQDEVTVATNLTKDQGDSNSSPAHIDLTRASITAYCFLHSGSDTVASIYQG